MVSIGTSANADRRLLCYSKLIHSFSNQSHIFIRYAQFFYLMLFLLSKIVFYGVQKLKGKCVFGKVEIIHVRHIVSSVAQKRNSVDFRIQSVNWKFFQSVLSNIQNRKPADDSDIPKIEIDEKYIFYLNSPAIV